MFRSSVLRQSFSRLISLSSSASLPSSFVSFPTVRFSSTSQTQKQLSNLSPKEIWEYVKSSDFIPLIDLVAAFFQLSKHSPTVGEKGGGGSTQQFTHLMRKIEESALRLRARDITNLFVAIRRLHITDGRFISMICEQAKLHVSGFNAQQISNTINALAYIYSNNDTNNENNHSDITQEHRELISELLKQTLTQLSDFTPQGLSIILNAIAKLDITTAASIKKKHSSIKKNASITNNSNNTDHSENNNENETETEIGVILSRICREIKKKILIFDSQSLACTLNALAKIDEKQYYHNIENHLVNMCMGKHFNAQDLSQIIHALAKFDIRNRALVAHLAPQIIKQASSLTSQGIANVLYGLAKLEIKDHISLVTQLCANARNKSFTPQEISNIFQALKELNGSDNSNNEQAPLFEKLCEEINKKYKHFNMQDVANTLDALTFFNIQNKTLVDQLCSVGGGGGKFTAAEISSTFHALAQNHVKDKRKILEKLCDSARNHKDFTLSDILIILESMFILNTNDPLLLTHMYKLLSKQKISGVKTTINVMSILAQRQDIFSSSSTSSSSSSSSSNESLIKKVYVSAIRLQELQPSHLVSMLSSMSALHKTTPNDALIQSIIEKVHRISLSDLHTEELCYLLISLGKLQKTQELSLATKICHLLSKNKSSGSSSSGSSSSGSSGSRINKNEEKNNNNNLSSSSPPFVEEVNISLVVSSLLAMCSLQAFFKDFFDKYKKRVLYEVKEKLTLVDIVNMFEVLRKTHIYDEKLIKKLSLLLYNNNSNQEDKKKNNNHNITQAAAQDIARVLRALACLNCTSETLLTSKLCIQLIPQIKDLSISYVIEVMYALVILFLPDVKLLKALRKRFLTENFENVTNEQLEKLRQCQLVFQLEEQWKGQLHGSCDRVFAARLGSPPVRRSNFLSSVSDTFKSMNVRHSQLAVLPEGVVVDIALEDSKVAFIVAGPTAMLRNGGKPLGATVLKHRILTGLGWKVSLIAFDVWDNLKTDADRVSFLQSLLDYEKSPSKRNNG